MALIDFTDWMDEFSREGVLWYVKRLSGNDTLANGTHQAGPYVPKELLFRLFPAMDRPSEKNPDVRFDLYLDSHADHRKVRAVWYNNKLHGGTRNEARLTGFGGQSSGLLDADSTGALTIFAFVTRDDGSTAECHVWVCRTEFEAELAEERLGPVEPGKLLVWLPSHGLAPNLFAKATPTRKTCHLAPHEIPRDWIIKFPTGADIIRKTVELRPDTGLDPDERLIRRRICEFEIFLSVEEAVELPTIRKGFDSIEEFVSRAQSILQRRKARSGRSLELHAREIFLEEGLTEGVDFAHGVEAEAGRRPDFLFPSRDRYLDAAWPDTRLRMLAVKTTCRDRWRQILNEADRITVKHLLTLQEGVSVGQFREMKESGVQLVIPVGNRDSFPKEIRPELVTLESFIGDIRLL
ncbi:MAG: type II restriction endonuclease [Pseudomonadota bacterium]